MDVLARLPADRAVTLIAEFTARPGKADAVDALLAGLAQKVRQEPGNIVFDCHRRLDDPARFVVYEVYQDRAAFEAHIGADYGAVFNAALRELITEPNSVLTFLQPLSTIVQ
ncbi:Quinol monooxygenase YgiN [Devosia lucknowensis]|uniref:Quinol monooxygenase YgiN n=1 Tax=Devosia lucknowensis TaxID=1096929 RepID=A0A1Y6FHD0_9HYPH|nr:putative quinol monooxygenase [Devosia lucknowensis]SMQ74265.1 Quinol monooxygenase YgiN [Devosia lucknowensis]